MDNQLPKYVEKYLAKFAYTKWNNYLSTNRKYNTIIVIPAISEFENIKSLISSLSNNDVTYFNETLILFVVNNLKSSSNLIKADNKKTLLYLEELANKQINGVHPNLNIDFIDASTTNLELDEKDGGVGLARKIGMDLAITLFDFETNSKNIIICLDGDCIVERNYISTIREYFNSNSVSAGYVNFNHTTTADKENERAIINYEIFLRYYVLGLTYANSPYAYHSIGSTMVCDVESYIKVQGMNKRKAAEDFYFMEKLSKITKIQKISGTAVLPSSRGSWRVPFGTGQRVNRFLDNSQNEYILYSPKSFEILKDWVNIFHSDNQLSVDEYLQQAKEINISLYNFLIKNNFKNSWEKILRNSQSNKQIQKQKYIWFDGFRTLKLIHYLRDTEFPSINMFDALEELFVKININFSCKNRIEEIPPIEIQRKYLSVLREIA